MTAADSSVDRARDQVVAAIFARKSIQAAADEAGISYSTCWRILQRPDVRAELTALRAERQRVVTEQLIKTEEYLASAAPTAIRVLIELATNSSGKVPFYVQATASDRLLAFMALGGGTQADRLRHPQAHRQDRRRRRHHPPRAATQLS